MPGTSPAPSDYVPPDPHAPPLVPGAEPVPGYVLVRQLGKGGFGEVWQATAPGGFPLAMKFVTLNGEGGASELRSLDILRELRHPNLLPVFGAWPSACMLAVAMELADGTLLDRLWEAQAAGEAGIPGTELLAHLRGAAAGLDYLHSRKLQHRDVKPQNLLLVGGAVKVADFGMVRALKESSSRHSSGMSVAYAPPEFFRERVSRHSDQYSLAVAYCELRGGRLPFTGNQAAVMFGHLEGEPDLSMLPAAERSIVDRALAKEAGERWPSCGEFAEAIDRAMAGQKSAAVIELLPSPTPLRRRGSAAVLLGLVVIIGVNVASWLMGERPAGTVAWPPSVADAKPDPNAPDLTKQPMADDTKMFVSQTTGMRFIRIPAGTFRMGSPESDKEAVDEGPQHEVTLTKIFYLGIHEVTHGQFRRFVDDTGYKTEAEEGNGAEGWNTVDKVSESGKNFSWRNAGFKQMDDQPVVNVSWTDAVRFAEWLSDKDQQVYRLPTEVEWEYSCRGGSTTKYHFGDEPEDLARFGNIADGTYKKQFPNHPTIAAEDGYVFTAPVGRFEPNSFGLYDMHGNVWEWCADGRRVYPLGHVTDPAVQTTGGCRVFRGGCWNDPAGNGRSAFRYWLVPSTRNSYLGFRLVRVPPSK